MKNKKTNNDDRLPKELAAIKSGEIFIIPDSYFDELKDKLFDENGHYIDPQRPGRTIHMIRPWLIAASFALILTLAWWIWAMSGSQTESLVNEELLGEYLEMEALEYDMETLVKNLDEEDILTLNNELSATYEIYINENIDQFDDLLYENNH